MNYFSYNKSKGKPDISDIVVCNVYWEDWERTSLQKPETGKIVVLFDFFKKLDLQKLKSIEVSGPSQNWSFDMHPFNLQNMNGFMPGPMKGKWFQLYTQDDFLENGRYTVTVNYWSGEVYKKSRMLDYKCDLLDAYKKIASKGSPKGILSTNNAEQVELKWSTVELDAFYVTRLREDQKKDIITNKLVFNNIDQLWKSDDKNLTLLNKTSVKIPFPLDPKKEYGWFTEVLDNNNFNEINLAIFYSYRRFSFSDKILEQSDRL